MTAARDDRTAIAFLLKLGRALHAGGAASYRCEEALTAVCAALGVRGQFFAAPTELMYSFELEGEERTWMQRTEPGEVDLARLAALEGVALSVIRGSASPAQAQLELERIAAAGRPWPLPAELAAFACASASAAWFFGGHRAEMATAALAGLCIGGVLQAAQGRPVAGRLVELAGAFLAALIGGIAAGLVAPLSAPSVTLAGIIVLLPGLSLTTAVGELARRHLASGTVRLSGALVVFLLLGFGAAAGGRAAELLAPLWPDTLLALSTAPLPVWLEVLVVAVAGLSFAILFQAPRRDAVWVVLVCALAYLGNAAGARGLGPELGGFAGAFTAGAASALLARHLDRPAVVTRVPAMTMLVPGSIGFLSFSSLLADDVTGGVATAFRVALVAISLVAGLLVAAVVVPPRRLL